MNDSSFHRTVSTGTVLVMFTATWCATCHTAAPALERLAERHPVRVVMADLAEVPLAAVEYSVRSLPTVVLLRDGVERRRWCGSINIRAIEEEL